MKIEEILIKFKSRNELYDFIDWFKEYGQYLYSEETRNSIQGFDWDEDNHIINM